MKTTIDLLLQLQHIDTARDAITTQKGSLPKEIANLNHQQDNLKDTLARYKDEISQEKIVLATHKDEIKKATELIARYKQEHLDASHDTETYDNITREIALQELNAKLARKKARASQALIREKNERIDQNQATLEKKQQLIQAKTEALAQIDQLTLEDETKLHHQRKEILEKITDSSLIEKYETLRQYFSLVVARVVQEACNGCFIIVPLQQQIKIREAKKLFMCENCHRMLVKVDPPKPEEE